VPSREESQASPPVDLGVGRVTDRYGDRMATYVVTGASTGIGEACARRLAAGGHRVLAGVRRAEDAERLRSTISGEIEPVLVDITDRAQVEAMAVRVGEVVGGAGLDGLSTTPASGSAGRSSWSTSRSGVPSSR
jgi:NAD(P)-dependent dehydrogenase (short-subunit alcohol dehydrogenase family)